MALWLRFLCQWSVCCGCGSSFLNALEPHRCRRSLRSSSAIGSLFSRSFMMRATRFWFELFSCSSNPLYCYITSLKMTWGEWLKVCASELRTDKTRVVTICFPFGICACSEYYFFIQLQSTLRPIQNDQSFLGLIFGLLPDRSSKLHNAWLPGMCDTLQSTTS